MYGMVTKALVDLIKRDHGDDKWQEVRERAGVPHASFVSMDVYPDKVMYDLVSAASEILDVPAAELLRQFGQYWTKYTMVEGYGGLFEATGSTLPTFLRRLDDMHGRLQLSFPRARPPSFSVEEEAGRELRIVYRSEREGLAPFVIGLLEGLGGIFDTEVEVTHVVSRADGAPHDVFIVRHGEQA